MSGKLDLGLSEPVIPAPPPLRGWRRIQYAIYRRWRSVRGPTSGWWVHPDTHEITKFMPNNPPERGDVVLVDGVRCRVLACPVEWDDRTWRMSPRGLKVRLAPREEGLDA